MPTSKPNKVSVLSFQVGFGDCYLLRFHYPGNRKRHVLIDFGSFPKAPWLKGTGMREVAQAIKKECKGKLDAVVATHRHADHITGFTTKEDDPGSVIASCKPKLVVQPWTEDPDARRNAKKPTASFMGSAKGLKGVAAEKAFDRGLNFVDSLDTMRTLLPIIEQQVARLRNENQSFTANRLAFYGENGLSNLSAVENLMGMAKKGKARYVFFGADSGLEAVLPGVKVHVLGPPTLEQSDTIKAYAKKSDEYWLTQTRTAMWLKDEAALFSDVGSIKFESAPAHARWLIDRLRNLKSRQLLEIVRSLDKVLNNTSVILLFEVGGKKLLFPGDAQLENWSYALQQPGIPELLSDVDFYKVGHHGSLNATPKTMVWENFSHRNNGLKTMVSTMKDVHGGEGGRPTEVPRETLVTALRNESAFVTTEKLGKKAGKFVETTIDI